MPADNKGANPIHEKKDDARQEKGDKGHLAEQNAGEQRAGTAGQPAGFGRGEGDRRSTDGNPDGSN